MTAKQLIIWDATTENRVRFIFISIILLETERNLSENLMLKYSLKI